MDDTCTFKIQYYEDSSARKQLFSVLNYKSWQGHWIFEIFMPLQVYTQYTCSHCMGITHVETTCSILLATSIQLQRCMNFFLSVVIFKSRLLNMADTVMAVEFGTIHHYFFLFSLENNFETWLYSSLNTYKTQVNICKLWRFGLE